MDMFRQFVIDASVPELRSCQLVSFEARFTSLSLEAPAFEADRRLTLLGGEG
jgi:hypothetical protein